MPQAQARVVAKGLTTMFIHHFNELVTKDYLDTRFSEFECRIGLQLVEAERATDSRFTRLESKMDVNFARIHVILGILLAAVAIPAVQTLLIWLI